jgi:hypothetical protein
VEAEHVVAALEGVARETEEIEALLEISTMVKKGHDLF